MQGNDKRNHIKEIDKMVYLSFPQKADIGMTENFRGIALPPKDAKVSKSMFINCIQPKLMKFTRQNQDGFQRNRSARILTVEEVRAKHLEATL